MNWTVTVTVVVLAFFFASLIIGIATSDTAAGSTVPILTSGYVTARRTTVTTGFTRNETAMTAVSMNVEGSYGPPAAGQDNRTISLAGTINFTDNGGASNYSNNYSHNLIFDAGAGNVVVMKVKMMLVVVVQQ